MSKKLVAYFSCSGVTARKAKELAEAAGADLFEIRPKVPYSPADLDWTDPKSRSTLEMKDPAARPEIAQMPDLTGYDTVFVGFPVWWYVAPAIIRTFLESADFSGKTVIPFATSGGSGLGRTEENLKPLCSGQTHWKPGRLLNGVSGKALSDWVGSLGLD